MGRRTKLAPLTRLQCIYRSVNRRTGLWFAARFSFVALENVLDPTALLYMPTEAKCSLVRLMCMRGELRTMLGNNSMSALN